MDFPIFKSVIFLHWFQLFKEPICELGNKPKKYSIELYDIGGAISLLLEIMT